MITIKARINLSENGGSINSLTSNAVGNNISSDIDTVLGKKSVNVKNPFILGVSKLGSGATYYSKTLPYFMGKQISNSNGEFATPYTFTINGSNITQFIITFDTTHNAYPKSITVDGKTIVDDDAQWEIVVNSANSHTITIGNWNKPNSPLIITSIYADVNIEIARNNLISFESDILDRSNIQQPTYGIISNSANIVFNDLNEQVLDLITKKLLHSGVPVTAYIDNDISNQQEQICAMYIQSLSYDSDNRQVNVSLKDKLEEWQKINVSAIYIDLTDVEKQNAKYYYNQLYNHTTELSSVNILSFDELDSDTQSILTTTNIEYPILDQDTLWNEWTKLCELCLLHIYVNNEGRAVVKYNGGN